MKNTKKIEKRVRKAFRTEERLMAVVQFESLIRAKQIHIDDKGYYLIEKFEDDMKKYGFKELQREYARRDGDFKDLTNILEKLESLDSKERALITRMVEEITNERGVEQSDSEMKFVNISFTVMSNLINITRCLEALDFNFDNVEAFIKLIDCAGFKAISNHIGLTHERYGDDMIQGIIESHLQDDYIEMFESKVGCINEQYYFQINEAIVLEKLARVLFSPKLDEAIAAAFGNDEWKDEFKLFTTMRFAFNAFGNTTQNRNVLMVYVEQYNKMQEIMDINFLEVDENHEIVEVVEQMLIEVLSEQEVEGRCKDFDDFEESVMTFMSFATVFHAMDFNRLNKNVDTLNKQKGYVKRYNPFDNVIVPNNMAEIPSNLMKYVA